MEYVKLTAMGAALLLTLASAAPAAPSANLKQGGSSALASSVAEPTPNFGPTPEWVRKEAVPSGDTEKKDLPFLFLLTNSQERLTDKGVENYVEYVVQPLNQAGLQAIGTVTIPWNVNRAGLTLHHVEIERGSEVIDALRREDVSVIRRESALEKSMLTGIRTVVLPVRGLQVGDKLRVGFTYDVPIAFGATEEIQDFTAAFPVGRMVRRFVVAKDLPVRWSVDPSLKEVPASPAAGAVERVFVAEKVEPPKKRLYVPGRFQAKLVQVSAFQSWQAVADPLIPMFDEARKVPESSPVAALAKKIAASNTDPEKRMLAALRMVQDDVRYVALLLGDGDYKPMHADDVWAGRFGDCKGKTVLLLALLDRLGIQAEPMLASIQFDDGLERRLPTLAMMDHVLVRAHVGGKVYYLDGTRFGQRTLDELRQSPVRHGLPLTANTSLLAAHDVMPSEPLQETLLVWDASKGVTGGVPFEATLILRGSAAAEMREIAVNSTDREKLAETLKNKVPGVSNEALELVSTEADAPDGSYVVRFKGTAEIDWNPVEGLKGNRMQLSQSTLRWDGEFDRDEGDGSDLPVLMAFPYWERSTEKVILPNGGKDFRVEAKAIDRKVAATQFTRTVTMTDGVVTAVNDFKRLERELSAEEARESKPELDEISGDFAYIVSKRKLKLPD